MPAEEKEKKIKKKGMVKSGQGGIKGILFVGKLRMRKEELKLLRGTGRGDGPSEKRNYTSKQMPNRWIGTAITVGGILGSLLR